MLVIPKQYLLSYFKDMSRWNNICDVFRFYSLDSTIILDSFCIPNENFNAIVKRFSQRADSVVSDGSFCIESLIGPSGTSSITVSLEIDCAQNVCATRTNWVTGPKDYQ